MSNMFIAAHKLYDRIIKVELARPGKGALKHQATVIDGTQPGVKPAIAVSVTMLPNSICLGLTVRITNCVFAHDIDIRTYSHMSVTMGYPGNTVTMSGVIFSAYMEKPNPDGVVVFDGVVTGEVGKNIFSNTPYTIRFWKKTNLKEFVTKVVDGLSEVMPSGSKLTADFTYCSPDILYNEIDFQNGEYAASNAYAVLNWMQGILFKWGKLQDVTKTEVDKDGVPWTVVQSSDDDRILQLVLRDSKVYVVDSHCVPNSIERKSAVILQAVKPTPSYAGPALTVSSIYNPRIFPGSVFYMDPVYFKGGATLPNAIGANIFNQADGLYRVIKMDIQFATVGGDNNMTLLAVPATMYEGDTGTQDQAVATIQREIQNTVTQAQQAMMAVGGNVDVSIEFGSAPVGKQQEETKDMWSAAYSPTNVIDVQVGPEAEVSSEYAGITTLSQLAAKAYGSQTFYLSNAELNTQFNRHYPRGVPVRYFFPLIMVATYKRMQATGGKGKSKYFIDPDNPDKLRANHSVVVPQLDADSAKTLIGNSEVATIFQQCAEFYKSRDMSGYADPLEDIYNYITKGKK